MLNSVLADNLSTISMRTVNYVWFFEDAKNVLRYKINKHKISNKLIHKT